MSIVVTLEGDTNRLRMWLEERVELHQLCSTALVPHLRFRCTEAAAALAKAFGFQM